MGRAPYQRLLMEDSLRGRRVAELMTPDPWTASPEMTLADLADRVMLANAVSFAPVVEQGSVIGQIDAARMREVPRADWGTIRVAEVMAPLGADDLIAPRTTAEEALQRLSKGPHRKLIVAEGRRLRGVLSLRDLMGHIAVVQALGRGGLSG